MSEPWIHSFSVTETQLHKGQFTIYRITSIIFPEANPGALSCVTVWKRFSDIKDLHQRLAKRLKQERLTAVKLPPLHKGRTQFFHRFDAEVIEVRRQGILDLLEFIGSQPSLYSCDVFTKFLQGGYTPVSSPRAHQQPDIPDGQHWRGTMNRNNQVGGDTDSEDRSSTSMAEDQISIVTTTSSQSGVDAHAATSVLHPRFSSDYVVEASEMFNEAVRLEVNDRYADALTVYKNGIEILMTGIRSDPDAVRCRLAKKKVEKYLSRSENIYEHFLKPPPPGSSQEDPKSRSAGRELPLNQLAKYKVIRVLNDNVMFVQEVTTRRFFIIKSIDRTSDWNKGLGEEGSSRDGDLTYMVSLVAYFVTEFVIFLLLQPASGGKIMDYVDGYENQSRVETTVDETIAPAYDTMGAYLDIEELLVSSQKLLNSVQKTLNESKGVAEPVEKSTSSSSLLNANQKIPEACVRQWAKELVVAVNGLHERNIVLGHLRADNLLLGKSGQLLLTYFYYRNYSKAIPKQSYSEETFLNGGASGPESDWYYVGLVLYELLTGCRFNDFHPGGMWYYFDLQYPEDVQLSRVALSFLRGLLREDPNLRFGFTDICGHSFFNEAAAPAD